MNDLYIPDWAFRPVEAGDRELVIAARDKSLRVDWGDQNQVKAWAKEQGWPAPWFNFPGKFLDQMLANDENFAMALRNSGISLQIPVSSYTLPPIYIAEMDESYLERSYRGLVEELRGIRRAVMMGVVVEVDGKKLRTFDQFYQWAHGRYYLLEDDMNTGWIGDDSRHPYS
jgi:hypothetical protein